MEKIKQRCDNLTTAYIPKNNEPVVCHWSQFEDVCRTIARLSPAHEIKGTRDICHCPKCKGRVVFHLTGSKLTGYPYNRKDPAAESLTIQQWLKESEILTFEEAKKGATEFVTPREHTFSTKVPTDVVTNVIMNFRIAGRTVIHHKDIVEKVLREKYNLPSLEVVKVTHVTVLPEEGVTEMAGTFKCSEASKLSPLIGLATKAAAGLGLVMAIGHVADMLKIEEETQKYRKMMLGEALEELYAGNILYDVGTPACGWRMGEDPNTLTNVNPIHSNISLEVFIKTYSPENLWYVKEVESESEED